MSNNELTAPNDFDLGDSDNRIIHGTYPKFLDGAWTEMGLPIPKNAAPRMVTGTLQLVQQWYGGKVVETITEKPLPSVDDLNASIPKEDWELGVDGKPKAPWSRSFVIYLLDPETAEQSTFAGSSIGASIAFNALNDAVSWMRKLRGENVFPLVTFSTKPMKTRFGQKSRPHFEIVGWKILSPDGAAGAPQLPNLVDAEPVSMEEALDDSIPF